jgi:glycerol-3-phosphate O-acyltransferase
LCDEELSPVNDRPLVAYEPNPLLAWLYQSFFEHIEVDEAWTRAVREAEQRGTVIYVLRNLSFVDFFALDYLTKRLRLPQVRFANDLGLWVLEPMGRGWLHALFERNEVSDAADLRRAVLAGESAALFLKRPPHLFEPVARGKGKIEGDLFIRTLFEVQRQTARPILLVPQVFVWSKHPDRAQQTAFDVLLGSREWPGKIRTVAQFLMNYRHVTLRAGEPVDVRAFLAKENEGQRVDEGSGSAAPSDDVLVRRMTYTLLRRLERERRAVVGPAKKPADRLREEVIRSPRLQKIITDMAGHGEADRRVLTERAYAMVREMEAAIDMNLIVGIDKAFEAVTSHMYSGLEVDEEGLARVRTAAKHASLILLPSHKSHVDYMVLAYLFYRNHLPLPIVAAGENLSFFPIGPVFRRAGAFFIRRSFHGDRLYGAVVDAYMRRLIKDGFTLEFFLEGGRSRTGKLLPPKMGLLSLVVDAALSAPGRTIYFVPISIGYERVVEEKEFVREVSGAEKPKEDVRGLLASAGLVRGRYGRLNVQFGPLLTLEGVLDEIDHSVNAARPEMSAPVEASRLAKLTPARRRAIVTRLAHRVMNEVNQVTAVTSGALVATALLTHHGRGIAHPDLVEACGRLARMLQAFGARFTPSVIDRALPGQVRASAVREACELFSRAGHLEVKTPGAGTPARGSRPRPGPDAIYVVPDEARLSLDLSKNLVVHFFVARALVATALLATRRREPPHAERRESSLTETLRDRVQALSRLFKYEFQFRADASFEQIFDETLAAMEKDGELVQEGISIRVRDDEGNAQVSLYAEIVRNFVEGYRVAARSLLSLVKGPLTLKDAAKRAITTGERMFLAGEIERREAISRPVIENAFAAFVDQGYVARLEGKIGLPDSYATPSAVRTIESRITGFLPHRGEASP